METVYLTQERYNELVAELKELKVEGRRAIAERLKQAKELGDLSENSEYQAAREDQSRLEQKIGNLEELIRHSSIIKKSVGAASVRIGSHVKVLKNARDVISYSIVGSSEAKPAGGFISNESPLGKNLLGKKVSDVVTIKTSQGETRYEILSID